MSFEDNKRAPGFPGQNQAWNNYFFNSNQHQEKPMFYNNIAVKKAEKVEQPSSNNNQLEFNYVEINKINIPIPNFVQEDTLMKLKQIAIKIQNEFDSYLGIPSLKEQVLNQINKDLIKKNEQIIQKFIQKPNNDIKEQNQPPKIAEKPLKIAEKQPKISEKQPKIAEKPKVEQKQIQDQKNLFKKLDLNKHVQQQQQAYNIVKRQQIDDDGISSKQSEDSYKSEQQLRKCITDKYQIEKINDEFSQEFRLFVNSIFQYNKKQQQHLQVTLKQQFDNDQKKQNKLNSNQQSNLISQQDFEYTQAFIDNLLDKIQNFGSNKQNASKKQNQASESQTIHFNYQENKVLKMISYSVLHTILCKQDKEKAKQYIFKILKKVKPNSKGYEADNFIIRQIHLLLLQILTLNADNIVELIEQFLNTIYQYDFLVTLILDNQLFQAFRALKIKNQQYQSADQNTQIDSISKANGLNLYQTSKKKIDEKKYLHSKDKYLNVYVYHEQSLTQLPGLPVYYIINPSDQFLISMHNSQ